MNWLQQGLAPAMCLAAAVAGARWLGPRETTSWLQVSWLTGLVLGLLSLASRGLEAFFPLAWKRGWHAHIDLVPGTLGPRLAYGIALTAPFVVWLLLLLRGRRRGRAEGRAEGRPSARLRWVPWALTPLVTAVLWGWPRLGGGAAAYPAFAWSTLVVVAVSLIAAGRRPDPTSSASKGNPNSAPRAAGALTPFWPEALRARGFEIETLDAWTAAPSAASPAGLPLDAQFEAAVARLLAPASTADDHGRATLVFGAEDAGEVELVRRAGAQLATRYRRRTLVVVPTGARELAAALHRVEPAGEELIAVVEGAGELPMEFPLWVTTAEIGAERVVPALATSAVGRELGLVVWWDLHRFSGVPAANLWALSHRLYRLLAHHGAGDLRTLALARRDPHASAQVERYVRRLLPHPESSRHEVRLEPRQARAVEIHLITSAAGFFRREPTLVPDRLHPLVVAARASIEAGWPTYLQLPESAAPALGQPLSQHTATGRPLAQDLRPRPAEAAVHLSELETGDALALPQRTGELGRTLAPTGAVHLAVSAGGNPYVEYLLRSLRRDGPPRASRRLVAAVGQPRVLHRHFLHALAELPGTGESLRRDFLAQEEVVQATLDQLCAEGNLRRQEVRYLHRGRELCRDVEYRSLRPPDRRHLPFDSAGGRLIDLRDAAAAHQAGGVLQRIDLDRLLIKAYPHRIFYREGQRYRVQEWRSREGVEAAGFVACELEARPVRSFRLRRVTLQAVQPRGDAVSLGRLTRQRAQLVYDERVDGAVLLTRQAAGLETAETLRLGHPLAFKLVAPALLLWWPQETPKVALGSLAEALRAVLPVHLGVSEDDLEIVPLPASSSSSGAGLALVELYAGGFGLLEPIAEDGAFQLELLAHTREWLARCTCRNDVGCSACLHGPAQSAAAPVGRVAQRAAALDALDRVLG